ncbi:hypothetical protein HK097_003552 [Rhizophlyctis rosea]|uniref:N-acetylgalactosaminide beta-1,3-galactosyltransferase n=1 Tax=Rhizophlyctis rosea TaxID=64517 RepID=A0AAD5S281_9FUNG|nr:hypothetical protein HK097_003552 [Rhizophlyctis rosea]
MPRGDGYDSLGTSNRGGSRPTHITPLLILSSPRFKWAFILAVLFTCGYLGSLAFNEHYSSSSSLRDPSDVDSAEFDRQAALKADAWRKPVAGASDDDDEVVNGGNGGKGGVLVKGGKEDDEDDAPAKGYKGKLEDIVKSGKEKLGDIVNGGKGKDLEEEELVKVIKGKQPGANDPEGDTNEELDEGTPDKEEPDTPPSSPSSQPYVNPAYDHFAVALKTGQDMAHTRAPVQLMTYLKAICNLIIIGEAPGVRIGDMEMIDVYTDLYKGLPPLPDPKKPTPAAPAAPKPMDKPKGDKRKRSLAEDLAHVEKPEIFVPLPLTPEGSLYKRVPQKRAVVPPTTPTKQVTDAVVEDKSAIGWRSDAHKNLPGFRELWQRYPDAKWFIMVDDDTYIFWENLRLALDKFNPEDPHYFGAKTMFKGCDGVKKFGDGPSFAHGGSGIVISRGALRKIMTDNKIQKCIEKYRTCWAGDIRTSLCLRDNGVLLSSLKGFNKEPPNSRYWFPREPCEQPLTFHHLLVKQIQKLYDLESSMLSKHKSNQVFFGDVLADWLPPDERMKEGLDRQKGDISNFEAKGKEECVVGCERMARCYSWVWDGRKCWLKGSVPGGKEVPAGAAFNVTSGVLVEKYRCLTRARFGG